MIFILFIIVSDTLDNLSDTPIERSNTTQESEVIEEAVPQLFSEASPRSFVDRVICLQFLLKPISIMEMALVNVLYLTRNILLSASLVSAISDRGRKCKNTYFLPSASFWTGRYFSNCMHFDVAEVVIRRRDLSLVR